MSGKPTDDVRARPAWRPPTRRAFVAMLTAAAGALAVRTSLHSGGPASDAADPPRRPWTGKTRWIGHC